MRNQIINQKDVEKNINSGEAFNPELVVKCHPGYCSRSFKKSDDQWKG